MRVMAPANEGVGIKFTERDPLHEDPQWYERDLDDDELLDEPGPDPLPTPRHRQIPEAM